MSVKELVTCRFKHLCGQHKCEHQQVHEHDSTFPKCSTSCMHIVRLGIPQYGGTCFAAENGFTE